MKWGTRPGRNLSRDKEPLGFGAASPPAYGPRGTRRLVVSRRRTPAFAAQKRYPTLKVHTSGLSFVSIFCPEFSVVVVLSHVYA